MAKLEVYAIFVLSVFVANTSEFLISTNRVNVKQNLNSSKSSNFAVDPNVVALSLNFSESLNLTDNVNTSVQNSNVSQLSNVTQVVNVSLALNTTESTLVTTTVSPETTDSSLYDQLSRGFGKIGEWLTFMTMGNEVPEASGRSLSGGGYFNII